MKAISFIAMLGLLNQPATVSAVGLASVDARAAELSYEDRISDIAVDQHEELEELDEIEFT